MDDWIPVFDRRLNAEVLCTISHVADAEDLAQFVSDVGKAYINLVAMWSKELQGRLLLGTRSRASLREVFDVESL